MTPISPRSQHSPLTPDIVLDPLKRGRVKVLTTDENPHIGLRMPSKPRLLVAEDDPEMRLLLGRALMREGFEVETAMNGEQAHRILGERPPFQILVSDLRMPMKDGEQLLREAIRNHPDLKVIIISGYADLDDYRKLKAEGAFDCLPKPFKVPDLLELIDRALEQ